MRIPSLKLRLRRRIIRRAETLEEVLDDTEGFDRLDMLGLLLLDEALERFKDVFRIIGVEVSIPVIDRDIVFTREAVGLALAPPVLRLFEFDLTQFLALGEVSLTVLLLVDHPVDERLEADDVVFHGLLRCSC